MARLARLYSMKLSKHQATALEQYGWMISLHKTSLRARVCVSHTWYHGYRIPWFSVRYAPRPKWRVFDVNTSSKSVSSIPHVRKLKRHEISSNLFRKNFHDVIVRFGPVWYHCIQQGWKHVVRSRSCPLLPRPSSGVAN
jgi:hypothetical protein